MRETYGECERCPRQCREPWDRERQARMRCPVVPSARRRWEPPGRQLLAYMGGEADDDPEPVEPNDEGCPGGWYRTPFFASLIKYLRPVSNGVYSPNLLLDRCDDPLVIEAVRHFESERARHRAWCDESINRQHARRRHR